MKHFTDPVLSRIQASMEAQLRKQLAEQQPSGSTEDVSDDLSAHPRMLEVTHICSEYQQRRKLRTQHYSYESREVPLRHLDPHAECLELYCRLALSRLYGDEERYNALVQEFDFSCCDPQWFEAIDKYFEHFGLDHSHQDIPYVNYQNLSDFVCDGLPSDLKIGILGDWGTGQSIAIEQLVSLVDREPDLIIHLGDVYYAGTEDEYESKLKDLIDKYARDKSGKPIPFLNMPGNHDMYAGGKAFYGAFDWQNERNELSSLPMVKQNASYFCLRPENHDWQILAMDTSYHDHNPFLVDSGITRVREREIDWMLDKVRSFPGKTILLSHHQPFSPFEEIGSMNNKKPSDYYKNPHLCELYRALQMESNNDVCLWIWGHEHNLCIYSPFAGIELGRCVGHSAVPVLSNLDPYAKRQVTFREALTSLGAGLNGSWGAQKGTEFAALWQLMFNKRKVKSPELACDNGKPLTLSKTADGNMYEHGYALMRFQQSDVQVDYFGGNSDNPIHTDAVELGANRP